MSPACSRKPCHGFLSDVGFASNTTSNTLRLENKEGLSTCMHAGTVDTMHEAITTAPTTVDMHDSHFGAAAGQDAADVPAAIYGGDDA